MGLHDLLPNRKDRLFVAALFAAVELYGVYVMLRDWGVLHG